MRVTPDTPFCIAILGDFSGREQQGVCESGDRLARRRPLQVDRDSIHAVMQTLEVHLKGLKLSLASLPIDLHFQTMDDFHPDQLFEKLEMFSALRILRQKLLDPDRFHDAAQEVLAWGAKSPYSVQTELASPAAPLTEATNIDGLLDNILEQSDKPVSIDTDPFNWNRMIADIVAPYSTNASIPNQAELIHCVDSAAQALMTNVLHNCSFSAMESAWRALQFLIERAETSPALKIYVLDIARSELAADLLSTKAITNTAIYQLLVERSEEFLDAPWGLLVGNYEFTAGEQDVALLERIARVAAACGAPFIASLADESVLESTASQEVRLDLSAISSSQAWRALRNQPESAYVGLVWPRCLLRAPYGIASKPIEAFDYEEIPDPDANPQLVWGNSAFLCAVLLAESFSRSGWGMQPNDVYKIENLPTWIYSQSGETQLRAGGQYLLTENELRQLRSIGAIALATIRDQDVIRLTFMQSLHQPILAGRWTD